MWYIRFICGWNILDTLSKGQVNNQSALFCRNRKSIDIFFAWIWTRLFFNNSSGKCLRQLRRALGAFLKKKGTGLFKHNAPNCVSHECHLQYLLALECRIFSIMLTAINNDDIRSQCFSWGNENVSWPTTGPQNGQLTVRHLCRKKTFFSSFFFWTSRF